MEKELIKFNENITVLSKEICKYEDEKGNMKLLPTGHMLVSIEYLELEEEQYKIGLFENIIDKELEYNKIKTIKTKAKSEITKNEKDKATLIDTEVEVYQAWVVKNGLNIMKSFNNKENAMKLANEINDKYLKVIL